MQRMINAARAIGISLLILLPLAAPAAAQPAPAQTPGQQAGGMMGGGMMHDGMMRPEKREKVDQTSRERFAPPETNLTATLHRWADLFFSRREELKLTVSQVDQLQAIFLSHLMYAIPKQAERRVMVIGIVQSLMQDEIDFKAVEQKVRLMETLDGDVTLEGVRTLQKAFGVLNLEQRSRMKSMVRGSYYGGIFGAPPTRTRPPAQPGVSEEVGPETGEAPGKRAIQ